MSELLEAALELASDGFAVFPVTPGKKAPPLVQDFHNNASTDPEQIKRWWDKWPDANIAIVPGRSNMVAVDVDIGADVSDLDLPPTSIIARTPRGGEHRFYELEDDEYIGPSVGKISGNIDLRSSDSYVLVAPSINETGEYYWDKFEEDPPTFRPDWLIEAATAAVRKRADDQEWSIEADIPSNVERATTWLAEDAELSVLGQGGDNTCYATAAHLRSMGISQGLALELMFDVWNPRMQGSWSWEKLELKVGNAYAYAKDEPGNFTPQFKSLQDKGLFSKIQRQTDVVEGEDDGEYNPDDYTVGRFRCVTRAGLSRMPAPTWLVKDFIPDDSYSLIYGTRGTFKTFIALDLALSLAYHRADFPAPGYWGKSIVGEPLPTLYAAGEGWLNLGKRVDAWQKYYLGQKTEDNLLLTINPVPSVAMCEVDSEEFEDFIEAAWKSHPKYSLTVLDTIGRSMQGLNENAQENASKFTRVVDEIKLQLGGAVLAIHHMGHQHEHARGSSVFETDPDTIIKLSKFNEKGYLVSASMTKQKDDEAWEEPLVYGLEKVILDPSRDLSSLVPRQPTEQEQMQNPEDPVAWIDDLIIQKLAEWGQGKKITQSDMQNYLMAKTGLSLEHLRPHLQQVMHSDMEAARHYRDGGWVA